MRNLDLLPTAILEADSPATNKSLDDDSPDQYLN